MNMFNDNNGNEKDNNNNNKELDGAPKTDTFLSEYEITNLYRNAKNPSWAQNNSKTTKTTGRLPGITVTTNPTADNQGKRNGLRLTRRGKDVDLSNRSNSIGEITEGIVATRISEIEVRTSSEHKPIDTVTTQERDSLTGGNPENHSIPVFTVKRKGGKVVTTEGHTLVGNNDLTTGNATLSVAPSQVSSPLNVRKTTFHTQNTNAPSSHTAKAVTAATAATDNVVRI
jgi:hypothetical protein